MKKSLRIFLSGALSCFQTESNSNLSCLLLLFIFHLKSIAGESLVSLSFILLFFDNCFLTIQTKSVTFAAIMNNHCDSHHRLWRMGKWILAILLLLNTCPAMAQKTKGHTVRQELSQARNYLKQRNRNYDQAEQLMTKLLKDSANLDNKDIYSVWLEAVKGQYDQANERLYLKQNQDTAAFFNLNRRLFTIAETLDSLDMRPDKKGHVNPEHRHKNAAMLNTHRPNLYNAGTFFIRKSNWGEAFTLLSTYIDCEHQPLFSAYNYAQNDARLPEAAYWATYSGYKLNDAEKTLQYQPLAMRDSAHADFALQFAAEAYRWKNNDSAYIATLEEGFQRYPFFTYFFPRLIDAYTAREQYDKALALADSALTLCDTCDIFLFAKSSVLLRMERWEESVVFSERLIHKNDSLPEPYFNAGTAFVNMAETPKVANDKKLQRTYYQKARTYMEYYRLLMPDEKRKWAPVLYRIYLYLNLGRQFDEVDKLLNS